MDNLPQKPLPKPPEKRPSQQGGNLVWYLLGLGVLLLLMVTVLKGGNEQELKWSDLERLIVASNPDHPADQRFIEIEDTSTGRLRKARIELADPPKIIIGSHEVTGKIIRPAYPN